MGTEVTDEELQRLAIAELLKEAERGAERAAEFGASAWVKRNQVTQPSPNKQFLVSTLAQHESSNKRKDVKQKRLNDSKFSKNYPNNEWKKKRKRRDKYERE